MRVPDRDLRCFAEKSLDTVASAEARKSPANSWHKGRRSDLRDKEPKSVTCSSAAPFDGLSARMDSSARRPR